MCTPTKGYLKEQKMYKGMVDNKEKDSNLS